MNVRVADDVSQLSNDVAGKRQCDWNRVQAHFHWGGHPTVDSAGRWPWDQQVENLLYERPGAVWWGA